jgi:hypothetical protein
MEAPIVLKSECLRYNGAGVWSEILRQTEPRYRRVVQVALLHAAQELLLATRWTNVAAPELICKKTYVEWRFEPVSYIFVPRLDDYLFRIYASARKRAKEVVVLIPPNYEMLVRKALERKRRRHPAGLFAVDDYLAWRTMWAVADARWSHQKVILWWLSRYNRFIRRRALPKSLIVRLQVPPSVPASCRL